jgi:hypothetical protein
VNPDAAELCNGIDDDCNRVIDEPCGCREVMRGSARYWFCERTRSWLSALESCAAMGMHLVTIANRAEDRWLNQTARSISTERWWIGYSDLLEEQVWIWVDDSASSYTNWGPGEPNNAQDEDCAQLNRFSGSDAWNDERCDQELRFICEQ